MADDQVLDVKRPQPLAGDEARVRVRATVPVRVNAGPSFECHAPGAGAEGDVTRDEWQRFLEPTGYFEEVS